MNIMFIFFKIVPLTFNTFIPVSFLLVKALMELFWYVIKLHCYISFNALHILESYTRSFSLENKKQLHGVRMEDAALNNPRTPENQYWYNFVQIVTEVTAIGHGRFKMQESKDYYVDRK